MLRLLSITIIALLFTGTTYAGGLTFNTDNRYQKQDQEQDQEQQQQQKQGQIQGQIGINKNKNHIGNVGSASGASVGDTANHNNSSATTGDQANAQTINFNGPEKTHIKSSGEVDINTTPDVMAPALTAGMNPCAMSSSAGGSITGFGISFGSSWVDEGCELRNLAGILHGMGHEDASRELLCQDERVQMAFAAVGKPCAAPSPKAETAVFKSIPDIDGTEEADSGNILQASYNR